MRTTELPELMGGLTLTAPYRMDMTLMWVTNVPRPEEEAAQKKRTDQKKLKQQNLMA